MEPLTNTAARKRNALALSLLANSNLPHPASDVTAPPLLRRKTKELRRLSLPSLAPWVAGAREREYPGKAADIHANNRPKLIYSQRAVWLIVG